MYQNKKIIDMTTKFTLFSASDTNMSRPFKVLDNGRIMVSINADVGTLYIYVSQYKNSGFTKLEKEGCELDTSKNSSFIFADLVPDTYVKIGADSGDFSTTNGSISLN